MAGPPAGPDATGVHTITDLVRELGLLRARAALGRHKTRVSIAELADRVGVPRSTVHSYLTGKHLPPATVLDRIVIALGATPGEQREWSEAWFRVVAHRESDRRAAPVTGSDAASPADTATAAGATPGTDLTRPVPRQLPPGVAGFCGRRAELASFDQLQRAAPPVVAAVTGGGGVGKTALALHWAHRVSSDYPDGQLWADLRGFDPAAPMDPGVVLAGFLRAVGVAEQAIPPDLWERSALYRTLLAARRVLVLLDNVSDTEQVRPLLPGSPSCMVVVTSRDRLTGLVARHGAHRIALDVLPEPEAMALLHGLIGTRVAADPAAAGELVKRCAALPLALRLAAERAVSRPTATLRDIAEELADEQRLLDLFDAGRDSRTTVRTVFSWSTRYLSDHAYAALRRLGLHPGASFDAAVLAALLDTGVARAREALAELADTHLAQEAGADRYAMHDLVRAWVSERAGQTDPEPDRAAALDRLASYYLCGAAAAMDLLYPYEKHRRPAVDLRTAAPPTFPDEASARQWLAAETDAMLAVAARLPQRSVAFAATLRRHLETTGRYDAALRLHGQALAAARSSDDQAAQAGFLINLSAIHARTGRYEVAIGHLESAIELCRATGDTAELARALDDLGTVHGRLGRYAAAVTAFTEALALCRELGDTDGEARALHNLGTVHGITGAYEGAERCFLEALALCRRLGDPLGEAYAVDNLGSVYCRMGRHPESVGCHERALALRRERGDRLGTAHALDNLGTAYRSMGHHQRALECHEQSLGLRREIGDLGDQPHALNNLGVTHCQLGQPEQAIPHHRLALTICRQTGNRYEQARAHDGLGAASMARGDRATARAHWGDALALYEALGVPEAATVRERLAELAA